MKVTEDIWQKGERRKEGRGRHKRRVAGLRGGGVSGRVRNLGRNALGR